MWTSSSGIGKFSEVFFGSRHVSDVSFLLGGEDAEMYELTTDSNTGLPRASYAFSKSMNSREISSWLRSPIHAVIGLTGLSEIGDSIIGSISIYVVDVFDRPFFINPEPSQTMQQKWIAIYFSFEIAKSIFETGDGPGLTASWSFELPAEDPSQWIIVKKLPKTFVSKSQLPLGSDNAPGDTRCWTQAFWWSTSSILLGGCLAKISDTIIVPDAVDMIDQCFWPFVMDHCPSEAMGFHLFPIYCDNSVSLVVNGASLASIGESWPCHSTEEIPCFRIISQQLSQPDDRDFCWLYHSASAWPSASWSSEKPDAESGFRGSAYLAAYQHSREYVS